MKELMLFIGSVLAIVITGFLSKLLRKDLTHGANDFIVAAIFWVVIFSIFSIINRNFI